MEFLLQFEVQLWKVSQSEGIMCNCILCNMQLRKVKQWQCVIVTKWSNVQLWHRVADLYQRWRWWLASQRKMIGSALSCHPHQPCNLHCTMYYTPIAHNATYLPPTLLYHVWHIFVPPGSLCYIGCTLWYKIFLPQWNHGFFRAALPPISWAYSFLEIFFAKNCVLCLRGDTPNPPFFG